MRGNGHLVAGLVWDFDFVGGAVRLEHPITRQILEDGDGDVQI